MIEPTTDTSVSAAPVTNTVLRRELALMELEENVCWWALSYMDLRGVEAKVRSLMETGYPERVHRHDRRMAIWNDLRYRSMKMAEAKPLQQRREEAWAQRKDGTFGEGGPMAKKLRHAALRSERAFVQICNLNHKGKQWDLAGFHVKMIRAMRQNKVASIFVPLEHAKSAHTSITTPLMDWAEWNDSSSGRVYWNQSHQTRWISLLMDYVERSEEIHQVFPWIRRPVPSDVSRHWSSEGFSIGGRTTAERSFEVLTARGHSTGNRYTRTGADDWVNSGNASSLSVQDGLEEYLLSGPMSFSEYSGFVPASPYGTVWGGFFYCGTFFDRRDVGYRFFHWCKENGYPAIRHDVYPRGSSHPEITLWMKERPPEYIRDMKKRLRKMFNKRMRNIVIDEGMEVFSADDVDAACNASLKAGGQYRFGKAPDGAKGLIGFDPAAGSRSRHAADPAICVYAEVPEKDENGIDTGNFTAHFVAWERLHGYDFSKQCNTIVEWARRYMLAVVIEKNTLQSAYKSQIKSMAPDVQVYDHQTGREVWDPDDGVETFQPLFANERAVIHADGAPEDELEELKAELVDWPQPMRKDILMAFWFARSKMRKRQKVQQGSTVAAGLPSYLDGFDFSWSHQ